MSPQAINVIKNVYTFKTGGPLMKVRKCTELISALDTQHGLIAECFVDSHRNKTLTISFESSSGGLFSPETFSSRFWSSTDILFGASVVALTEIGKTRITIARQAMSFVSS